MLGERLNWSHPFARGLVGCWLMNESRGNKIYDLSGNQSRYLGDFVADTTWKPGKSGPSTYFDGTGDIIELQLWDGGAKVTLFARVKFEETIGATEQITAADSSNSGLRTFQLCRNTTGNLNFTVFVANTAIIITGNTILTTGQWWDVAAVNNGANAYIYVNGIQDATPVTTGNMDTDIAAWAIGGRPKYVNWEVISEPLQGRVEFLMRWNKSLSAAEIARLYREPFAMFDTYPVWWFYIFGEGGEGAGGQMIFGGQRILDGGVVR
jgi:hypothetical protein